MLLRFTSAVMFVMFGFGAQAAEIESGHTVAIVVNTPENAEVTLAAAQSLVWHSLNEEHDHVALVLNGTPQAALAVMKERGIRSLFQFDVSWDRQVVPLDGGMFIAAKAPSIDVAEYIADGDRMVPRATWTSVGATALYRENNDSNESFLSLPEVALQEAVTVAVKLVAAPIWGGEVASLPIPIAVVADEEYRAFYGPRWRGQAMRRIERASVLLGQAGLSLKVVYWGEWNSNNASPDLSVLLDDLASGPLPAPAILRVGFTQQTALASVRSDIEELGHAYLPGTDVIIADQASPPGHLAAWDVAEEGVAVAHEVLHALGVPHTVHQHLLMSETKSSVVHVMSEGTRKLARAAAQARLVHWDKVTALVSLSAAAESWLIDDELKVDFIIENLDRGPGVPPPGELRPDRHSALTNVAVGRYYFREAEKNKVNAEYLRGVALAHSEAAAQSEPAWGTATDLVQKLIGSIPRREVVPEVDRDRLGSCDLDELSMAVDGASPDSTCPR